MQRSTLVAGVLLLFSLTAQIKASAITPVVEYSSVSLASATAPITFGYEFTTSIPFTVNALGYWNDGLGHNHDVGIWDSAGNLLVSTTVLGTDALIIHFRYHSIADYLLAPGDYVIGGLLAAGDQAPINATGGIATVPGYSYVEDREVENASLSFPTHTSGGFLGPNAVLAVDFSAVPTAATIVPEIDPSEGARTICLLLGALLVLRGRRKSLF